MNAFQAGDLLVVLLLSVRLGAVALMVPPIGISLPGTVRVALVVALSVVLAADAASLAPLAVRTTLPPASTVLFSIVTEFALGAAMGLGVNLAFAAFAAGARLLDIQIGFGIGQVYDPLTRQRSPVLTAVYHQAAMLCFFLLDFDQALVRGMALGIEQVPPGSSWLLENAASGLLAQGARLFTLGFALVAPVAVCLLLVDFGLGVMTRNMPQMNAMVLGMPLKVIVGLACLSAWIVPSGGVMSKTFVLAFETWAAIWR